MILFQFTPGYFGNAIQFLEQLGVADIILPFILIFTVLFAVLQRVPIFGANAKRYNIIFALVVSLLALIPHVTQPGTSYDIIPVINNSLPQIALVVVALLMVMMMTGLIGFEEGEEPWKAWGKYFVYIAAVIVIYIFGASAGLWQNIGFFNYFNDPNLLSVVVILLVFGIVIWFITSEGGDKNKGTTGGGGTPPAGGGGGRTN